MSHTTTDLVTSIDERLAQARAEIASLEAALRAFATPPAPTRSRRPGHRQPADATPTRATSRRTRSTSGSNAYSHSAPPPAHLARPDLDSDTDAARLQALLSDHDGLTTTAIADHAGANRIRILAVLRRLEADGQIRRTGVRRSTRWHAISDEDRIAQRASAQLARQSKAAGATSTRPVRRAARRS